MQKRLTDHRQVIRGPSSKVKTLETGSPFFSSGGPVSLEMRCGMEGRSELE
jgi:hypothetical protein